MKQGVYRYRLNGEDAGVTETWSRSPGAEGTVVVNSTRRAPGIELDVAATERAGDVVAFEVAWRADGLPPLVAHYQRTGAGLRVTRREGGEAAHEELVTPGVPDYCLFPLMRVFTGPLLDALWQRGGEGLVILPSIADPGDRGQLLRPQLSERRVSLLDDAAELEGPGGVVRCRLYNYSGDQYGDDTRFWVDAQGLLQRYCWQQGGDQSWDIRLGPSPAR